MATIAGTQIRMARAALKWGVRELGQAAGVNPNTVARIEGGADALTSTLTKIQNALESAGIEFTNDEAPGVRLKPTKRKR